MVQSTKLTQKKKKQKKKKQKKTSKNKSDKNFFCGNLDTSLVYF